MRKSKIALLLAGGTGTRLNILASLRAKPAVPFGGLYRLIDFTLSNLMHSGFEVVGILTQYKPFSLMNHIVNGQAWDFVGRMRNAEILPPHTGGKASDWYKGTADAVFQNLNFINDYNPDLVLIVSGDHIYKMDYNEMIDYHLAQNAALTVGLIQVPASSASHFGVASLDRRGRVTAFEEKPRRPKSNLASMGVYVFDRKVLTSRLARICSAGGTDFARDVLPALLPGRRVNGYVFDGYWRDVGTIQAYWEANRDILKPDSGLDLQRWEVRTNLFEKGQAGDRPSAYVGRCARVARSLLCRGDHIEGTVIDSILSPGVRVEPGAVVRSAVLLHDCIIGRGSAVELSIIDKNVRVGARCRIGVGTDLTVNREFPKHLFTGITLIGKNATIPEGSRIGRNCLVFPGVGPDELRKRTLPSGETMRK